MRGRRASLPSCARLAPGTARSAGGFVSGRRPATESADLVATASGAGHGAPRRRRLRRGGARFRPTAGLGPAVHRLRQRLPRTDRLPRLVHPPPRRRLSVWIRPSLMAGVPVDLAAVAVVDDLAGAVGHGNPAAERADRPARGWEATVQARGHLAAEPVSEVGRISAGEREDPATGDRRREGSGVPIAVAPDDL